jgi:aminoglycoside phosphotransferase (APT) family kinase protein
VNRDPPEPLDMQALILRALQRSMANVTGIRQLRPLSGGAVQETWAFEAVTGEGTLPLILRRARGTLRDDRSYGIDLATEAQVVQLAERGGVPVPHVRKVLSAEDELGAGFVMDFVRGETIPRRILRDEVFATARASLAHECGTVLALIHQLDHATLQGLDARQPSETIELIDRDYRALDAPSPVFELAFRWLSDNMPPDLERLSLIHGDFRNGNLLVAPEGLQAVLDWEGAHVGDPHEDLGYISIPSWRFGEIDRPVGGFGTREALFAAYEGVGGNPVEPDRAHFWELAYTLNWGIQCAQMAQQFLTAADPSVERGAIGRRRSETELDLLRLLNRESADAR